MQTKPSKTRVNIWDICSLSLMISTARTSLTYWITHWGLDEAYAWGWTSLSLVEVMAWYLTGKPLAESMIVNSILGNKLKWNLNQNSNIPCKENALQNIACKMSAILFWSQCENRQIWETRWFTTRWRKFTKIYSYLTLNILSTEQCIKLSICLFTRNEISFLRPKIKMRIRSLVIKNTGIGRIWR